MATVQIRRTMETYDAQDVSFYAGWTTPEGHAAEPDDVVVMIEIPTGVDGKDAFRVAVPWSMALLITGRVQAAVQEATRLRMEIEEERRA